MSRAIGLAQWLEAYHIDTTFCKPNHSPFIESAAAELRRLDAEIEAALKEREAPPKSQPIDHVGDSAFEAWFSEYDMANKGTKQQMRDAYAAGITDAERHHEIGD